MVVADGRGRLHPVAHLTLRDPEWLDAQLAELASGGVRLAMIAPAAVEGRPLSHPDHDRMWAAFVDHGITPVFHVADQPRVLDEAFYTDPDDSFVPVIESIFLWVPPAMAVTDLIVNGVLAKHPGLRIGIVELSSIWVPQYLLMLDGGWDFTDRAQRPPAGPSGDEAERVLPPPGPRLVVLVRAAGTAHRQIGGPVHVLQRLPPLRGHRHAHRGLRPLGVCPGGGGRLVHANVATLADELSTDSAV